MFPYRLLISLFALWTLARAPGAVRVRLGAGRPQGAGPHVWLHGASNGELASVRPLLARLVDERPDLRWLVTCNSASGLALIDSWQLPRVTARPAPLDLAWVTRRLVRRWQIRAHVTLEAEIWPHRVCLCPGPVIVLGARMSAGTARTWARLPGLARRVLGRISLLSAQDEASLARLSGLGLPDAARGPVADLKAFYTPPDPVPDPALEAAFPRSHTWLAASTHPGEDEIVLDAHRAALGAEPGLRLILAPRHPARGDALEALIRARGLRCTRRSRGEQGTPDAAGVLLADTMGEMALWYRLAGRVFIGGSLVDRGGHTPYEPAAFGCALIHGPDMRNFAPARDRLAAAGLAETVASTAELAAALHRLGPVQAHRGAQQARALQPQTGLAPLAARVLDTLPDAPGA